MPFAVFKYPPRRRCERLSKLGAGSLETLFMKPGEKKRKKKNSNKYLHDCRRTKTDWYRVAVDEAGGCVKRAVRKKNEARWVFGSGR